MGKKNDGSIMSEAEEQAMREFEQDVFGHPLERDVNGDPTDDPAELREKLNKYKGR